MQKEKNQLTSPGNQKKDENRNEIKAYLSKHF